MMDVPSGAVILGKPLGKNRPEILDKAQLVAEREQAMINANFAMLLLGIAIRQIAELTGLQHTEIQNQLMTIAEAEAKARMQAKEAASA